MDNITVSLVTGGAGGLGSSIVKRLIACGHHVVLSYLSSSSKASSLADNLGPRCIVFCADLSKKEDVAGLRSFIAEKFGKLDNLINNAAITKDGLLIKYSESDWEKIMAINLKGAFIIVKEMVPLIIAAGGGHIVNISSYSGVKGKAGQSAYSASKAGMIGLSISLAKEFAGDNIRVNTVLPGYMETNMGAVAKEAMAEAKDDSLLGLLSDPDEAAGLVEWLCSTSRVTGQLFALDSRII
ncbi:MAG: SDR family NAD(P)-dependent oxidoreductase [Nitrospirota bacterium]|nr:MAG: SDR family NAD(P)-dependent oxidoreductase [Nitrospirota bacterium]